MGPVASNRYNHPSVHPFLRFDNRASVAAATTTTMATTKGKYNESRHDGNL